MADIRSILFSSQWASFAQITQSIVCINTRPWLWRRCSIENKDCRVNRQTFTMMFFPFVLISDLISLTTTPYVSLRPFTDGIYGIFTHFFAPSFHELNSVIQRSWKHIQTDKLQKLTLICQWANAHFRQRLALWRGVLIMDKSGFSACRADGRRMAWCG